MMLFSVSLALAVAVATAPPPVYPGALPGVRPAGVGFKTPPPDAKAYVTPDDFNTVKTWYAAHLPGAQELQQPGMEKIEDAFLVGDGKNGSIVLIQSYKGKTWIVIGPPL